MIAGGIVVATAANSFSASVAEINLANAARTLRVNLRGTLFAHLQRLPLAFHVRRSTGDVLTRLTGDVKAMEDFVEDSAADLVGSVFVLAASLYYLFNADPLIGLLALTIVPLLTVISNLFARRIKSASKQQRASEGELASTAQEMLSAISLVQVYGRGVRAAEVRAAEQLGARGRPPHGKAGGVLRLHRRRDRVRRYRGRGPGGRPAGGIHPAHPRGAHRDHRADPGHVQADPPDHQAVQPDRGRLRQRGPGR